MSTEILRLDLPVMILAALSCLPIFPTGFVITRGDGALLPIYYAGYLTYLLLAGSGHALLPLFLAAFIGGVMPVSWLVWVILHRREFGSAASR